MRKRTRSGSPRIPSQRAFPVTAYLGLGANLGDREANISAALRKLDLPPIIELIRVSSLYETKPVGVTDQPDFLNAVAEVQTLLPPELLLETVLEIEKNLGRVRTRRWGPRVIDIDVLLYDNQTRATPTLTIPHPGLEERAFVLAPLAEIAPELVLNRSQLTAKKKWESFEKSGNNRSVKIVKRDITEGPSDQTAE